MSSPPASGKSERLLWRLALVSAGLYVLAFLAVALARAGYPFELEWMEGGMADHVARILEGRPIYVSPSLEFVPYGYTPLYFYAAAGVAWLLGMGFFPLRLLSILSSLGAMALIYRLVVRQGKDRTSAFLAAGIYAACFALCGFWYDTARLDPFFLLLLLASATVAAEAKHRRSWLLAGAMLGFAYLTKQTALPIALAIAGFTLLWQRQALLPFSFSFAAIAGGGSLLLNSISGGWFAYYTLTLPRMRWATKQLPKRWLEYWTLDLLAPLAIALALAGIYFLVASEPQERSRRHKPFFLILLGAILTSVWISRVEYGAYGNVLLPAYAAVAIGAGLGLSRWRAGGGLTEHRAARWRALVPLLVLIQFATLGYNPRRQVPTRADRVAGKRLLQLVARQPGAVWLPHHAYLARMAGKPPTAHEVAIKNLIRIDPSPVRQGFETEIERAIGERRYSAIIVDQGQWYRRELEASYRIRGPVFASDRVFFPVVGRSMRPELVWVPQAGSKPKKMEDQ